MFGGHMFWSANGHLRQNGAPPCALFDSNARGAVHELWHRSLGARRRLRPNSAAQHSAAAPSSSLVGADPAASPSSIIQSLTSMCRRNIMRIAGNETFEHL